MTTRKEIVRSCWGLTRDEIRAFKTLNTPIKIQSFLDSLAYNTDDIARSPRCVLEVRRTHCMDGALFGAAALRLLGHRPLLMDLRAVNDDDHVLAIFNQNGRWGCISKSNYTTTRYRDPVYRSLRELAMSFFDVYFNTIGQKTLREYSVPLDLARYDKINWMTTKEDLSDIGWDLDRVRHFFLITPAMARALPNAPPALVKFGLSEANPAGLFKPKK